MRVQPKHLLAVREKGGDDSRWWCPDRDITVVVPAALRAVFYKLSQEPDGAMVTVYDKLGVTTDDVKTLLRLYARLVSCVELRQDPSDAFDCLAFDRNPAQALVGLVFTRLVVEEFASRYGATLHRGEDDPNQENLGQLRILLQELGKPESVWRRFCRRVRCAWVILRSPM